eukprot:5052284-Pyramimonas_sp.AAC.1
MDVAASSSGRPGPPGPPGSRSVIFDFATPKPWRPQVPSAGSTTQPLQPISFPAVPTGSRVARQLGPLQNSESLMTPTTTAKPTPTSAPDPISPATAKATTPHPTPWKTH